MSARRRYLIHVNNHGVDYFYSCMCTLVTDPAEALIFDSLKLAHRAIREYISPARAEVVPADWYLEARMFA